MDPSLSHAAQSWRDAAGPPRAEHATTTALATALVVTQPGGGVAARATRILQLRLAARALR